MKRWLTAVALAAALAVPAASGLAQPQQQPDPAQERSTQFRAMQGPSRENIAGGPLLLAAYAIAWALVLAYVARLGLLQKRTARDLDRLETQLKKQLDGKDPAGKP